MKRQFELKRRQLEFLKDFIALWKKYNNGEKLDDYGFCLIDILNEYEYVTKYRPKKWRKTDD